MDAVISGNLWKFRSLNHLKSQSVAANGKHVAVKDSSFCTTGYDIGRVITTGRGTCNIKISSLTDSQLLDAASMIGMPTRGSMLPND